jgi:hypothetical protein
MYQVLEFAHFYVWLPFNPLTEDYIEVFHTTVVRDIPSIQCKMSLRGLKSVRISMS